MICQRCNFYNEETAKFCRNCGVNINSASNKPKTKPYTEKRFKLELSMLAGLLCNLVLIFPLVRLFCGRMMLKLVFTTYIAISILLSILCLTISIKQIIKYKEERKEIIYSIFVISIISILYFLYSFSILNGFFFY